MPEEIQEHGVVLNIGDGIATVSVVRSGSCEDCGARILCKITGDDTHQVTALDPLGVKPGDHVRIAAPGKSILLASVYLYGIPLLLLLLGIILGSKIFAHNSELYGSLIGISFCAVYYFAVHTASGSDRQKKRFMPRIDKII